MEGNTRLSKSKAYSAPIVIYYDGRCLTPSGRVVGVETVKTSPTLTKYEDHGSIAVWPDRCQ